MTSVDRLTAKVDRTADSVAALLAVAEIQSGEIRELGESVRAVDDHQRETRENLIALITTVDRLISETGGTRG